MAAFPAATEAECRFGVYLRAAGGTHKICELPAGGQKSVDKRDVSFRERSIILRMKNDIDIAHHFAEAKRIADEIYRLADSSDNSKVKTLTLALLLHLSVARKAAVG